MSIQQIIRNSNHNLDLFSSAEIAAFEENIITRESNGKQVFYFRCLVRDREVRLKPEEVVRQLFLRRLLEDYGYPKQRVAVEFPVKSGAGTIFADIVIKDKDHPDSAYIVVELKKPKWKEGKDQLKSYCNVTGSPIGVWTNGAQINYYHRKDPNYFEPITDLPKVTQTLADILSERFTIDDLIARDRLREDKRPLKDIVLDMEDEVLANAGVDVFEEVFKLVFTKLYDEHQGARNRKRLLEFRNTGQTEAELKQKIQTLFDRAKNEWPGVFSDDAKIALTRSHLSICVASLQNVKLFNTNLDVIDEAFEYLVNKSSKGEKGQYFTPRYVIDMCVRVLNPREDEYLIDTAAGSAGFTVHGIFKVWKDILADEGIPASHLFTAEQKPSRCADYVRDRVFAIDFDEKSVRVARTLNLIAGDGQTNVLHLNTLDFGRWEDGVTGRLDAEFYHPKYEMLEEFLKRNHQVEYVGSWGKVLKGESVEYTGDKKGIPVIRSGDLSDIEDEGKFLRASRNQEIFLLKRGDVLISSIGFGSIGKVQVFDKAGAFATVSEVTVIRQKRVNPYYLHFYLRSPAGQTQINRYITGATGQLHLYPKDVGNILVPIVSPELENDLQSMFMEARKLKKQSRALLDTAKRGVEIAIEQDEATALTWMENERANIEKLFEYSAPEVAETDESY